MSELNLVEATTEMTEEEENTIMFPGGFWVISKTEDLVIYGFKKEDGVDKYILIGLNKDKPKWHDYVVISVEKTFLFFWKRTVKRKGVYWNGEFLDIEDSMIAI